MKTRFLPLVVILLTMIACQLTPQAAPAPTHQAATQTVELTPATPTPTQPLPPTAQPQSPSSTPQPVWEWPRSTPEEQGLSSSALASMLEAIQQEKQNIHSVLVIRHGTLVLEAYVHPFNAQTRHGMYSVTKSITSALAGIARGEGLLGDIDRPVISYFPSMTLDDPRKGGILVEHLLTMTSGVEWTEPLYSGLSDLWGIHEADDPAGYFFTPALLEEPGTVFNYNSGGSHLLSMLVQEAAGQPAAEFAASRLFAPLDIRDYAWKSDFTGHTQGGTGLELKALDAAKIGQMYLDDGQWQGKQIVPAGWVQQSTRPHSTSSAGMGYGYQWWIRSEKDYYALGWGGQQIRVFPQQDMLVVFTAGSSGADILHNGLVDDYLLPAVQSDSPLPADTAAQSRLDLAIRALASPQKWPSGSLPPLAAEIDSKQWLVTGQGSWSMFSLQFSGSSEAQLDLTLEEEPMPLKVGLDGSYRVTDTEELGPVALAGYWETPDTFTLVQQNLREADRRTTRLQFAGDKVKLNSEWLVEPHQEESEAELFGQ
jgi:CubicO group peptidase (beta-lactamase class C family)